MRKWIPLLAALALLLCLTACGGSSDGGSSGKLPSGHEDPPAQTDPAGLPDDTDSAPGGGEDNTVSTPGDELTAADLLGSWVMTEDNIYDPAGFAFTATLDFCENELGMIRASYLQQDDNGGKVRFDEPDMPVTFLEGALYSGCPNQSWYIALERTSDHPSDDTAFSAALIDSDTLYLYTVWTLDGSMCGNVAKFERNTEPVG